MRVLVPFKRVQDPATGTQWLINPFDEIAIEEGLRLKENGLATEVVGVTVCDADGEEQLRAALAMGLDRVIRIDDPRTLDPYSVSRILLALVRREHPDVVLMGKQAVDDDAGQTGQMLAGLLGWPQATFISKVEKIPDEPALRCTRETDAGLEVITVALPAVLTTDLRLNEPRYVSLPGLMKARRRPIELITCAELGVAVEPKTRILAAFPAPRRTAGIRLDSVEELVSRLRDHEKVL